MRKIPVRGLKPGSSNLSRKARDLTIKTAKDQVTVELEVPGRKNDGPPSVILQWTEGQGWCVLVCDGLAKVAQHRISDHSMVEVEE